MQAAGEARRAQGGRLQHAGRRRAHGDDAPTGQVGLVDTLRRLGRQARPLTVDHVVAHGLHGHRLERVEADVERDRLEQDATLAQRQQ